MNRFTKKAFLCLPLLLAPGSHLSLEKEKQAPKAKKSAQSKKVRNLTALSIVEGVALLATGGFLFAKNRECSELNERITQTVNDHNAALKTVNDDNDALHISCSNLENKISELNIANNNKTTEYQESFRKLSTTNQKLSQEKIEIQQLYKGLETAVSNIENNVSESNKSITYQKGKYSSKKDKNVELSSNLVVRLLNMYHELELAQEKAREHKDKS
jgi:hypothetical protein